MSANAAIMLLLAHRLELSVYGLFVTTVSAQILLSRVLILGVDGGMIRLRTIPELRHHSEEVVQAGLAVLLSTTAIVVLGALGVGLMLPWVSAPVWSRWVLASIVCGGVGTALVDYGYSYRLALLQYRTAGLVQGSTAAARLVLTTLPLFLLTENLLVVFLAYPAASLLSGLSQTIAIKDKSGLRAARPLVGRLLSYSLWQGGADITLVLYLYQGTFLLMLLGQEAETGLYGLGLMLSMGFLAIYTGFNEYLYPRIVHIASLQALPKFLMRSYGAALLICMICVPVVIAIGILIPLFLRPELRGVVPIFYCLSASMLLLIFQCPLKPACHYLLRPNLLLAGEALRVICAGILGFIFAPTGGALGMAVAQLGGTTLSLVALTALFTLKLRSARKFDAAEL